MSEDIPAKIELGGEPQIDGRAVCDTCGWSTVYQGQIRQPGKEIVWEAGAWQDTDETKILKTGREVTIRELVRESKKLKCPVDGGTMRYQPLEGTAA